MKQEQTNHNENYFIDPRMNNGYYPVGQNGVFPKEQTTMEARLRDKFNFETLFGKNSLAEKGIISFIQLEIDLAVAERDKYWQSKIDSENENHFYGCCGGSLKDCRCICHKKNNTQYGSTKGASGETNIRLSNQEVSNKLQDIEDNTSPLDRG